ncbi:hypothetical protein PCH_Pc12g13780 [Penicillium rubens Wisconsin 54-1255]|uniref:Uncharacterized protein n=1 Tax=Penicillium rubens (strain ATCC 28089 / DSM 1075 / NRRL 1951 / Wisconsin 54-1255) TaxID=500485 RepID=B6H097_PENRW|nr:hypothetical protein PCH_Pc12g13780 [Penicillium rubens Wisconsin 54-1255]
MPATRSQTKPSDTNRIPDIDRTCSQGVPGPIIEWLDLDFSEMSPVKQMNWRNSLNEIQAFEGCRHITFACPLELAHRLWIIIRRSTGNAKTTLYQYSDNVYSIYRVDYCIGKMIHAGFPMYPDPRQIHEVWMVYFPTYTLDSEKKRERQLPILLNFYGRDEEPSNPMSGILSHNIAWLSGKINNQGVQCQRLAWFMEWKSKEAEELYKTTVRWVREDKGKSCKPQLTLSMFIDDLKSLGMVGYETWHAHFEDIREALDNTKPPT